MKGHLLVGTLLLSLARLPGAETANANTVILDEAGVRNLRIETVVAEASTFEETVFALGRIEPRPEKVASVASPIAGRVTGIDAVTGGSVEQGKRVLTIESRQPGNPPPSLPLRAPLAGLVTDLHVRLGDPVDPDRSLMQIVDLGEMLAIARVPEAVAGRLTPDSVAHISVPAVPGAELSGKLVRLGTAADREAGTIDAIFSVENPGGRLRPGMRAEFSIVVGRRENVVAIPRSALQGDPANRFVYVKHFDLPHAFVKTPVVVGQTNDRHVEIVSGLFPADEVVTRGAYSLAFAGGGTISLKEALDAAHGHEHNPDGSEMTPEQKAAARKTPGDRDRGDQGGHDGSTPWKILSAALFVALVFVAFMKRSK